MELALHVGLPLAIALIVGAPSFVGEIRRLWALRESDEWPMAEATVQSATERWVQTDYSHYFAAELGYCYVVKGSYYSGYIERRFKKEREAREYRRKTTGTKFSVRYDPVRFELSKAVNETVFGEN